MPEGFDESTGRLYFTTKALAGGMNLATPKRTLTENEASRMFNVLSRFGKIMPGSQKLTLKWILEELIYHQFTYNTVTNPIYMLMDTTRAWAYLTGAPTEVTPVAPFTNTQPLWKGATLLHNSSPVAVVTNFGNDYPHFYNGTGVFTPITNAPKARSFCGYLGRMFTGNVYDSDISLWRPNRIQWSAFTDLTLWDYGVNISAGYLDLNDDLDPIYNIEKTTSNLLVVFRRRSIYVCYSNALAENPITDQYSNDHGIVAPNTLQRVGGMFFYLGEDDIYSFTTSEGSISIGTRIRDELLSLIDPSTILHSWSFLDYLNKEYYLVLKHLDGLYYAWIYNYEQQSWTMQHFEDYVSLGMWYA